LQGVAQGGHSITYCVKQLSSSIDKEKEFFEKNDLKSKSEGKE